MTKHTECYQDHWQSGELIAKGYRECESRWQAISSFLNRFIRPVTVLDIGANRGYFGARILHDYPESVVVSLDREVSISNLYSSSVVLKHELTRNTAHNLSKCESFDVILAMNVLHHFELEQLEQVWNSICRMGEFVISETPNALDEGACGGSDVLIKSFELIAQTEHVVLGRFESHTDVNRPRTLRLHHTKKFEQICPYLNCTIASDEITPVLIRSDYVSREYVNPRTREERKWIPGINLWTYLNMGGIIPDEQKLTNSIDSLRERTFHRHGDIKPWNIIIDGAEARLIDWVDHSRNIWSDESGWQLVSDYVKDHFRVNRIDKI